MMRTATNQIVLAIIIGSALVAATIFFTFSSEGQVLAEQAEGASPMRTENRLVYGAEDAPTTIVEFSDYECPFCARLHPTLKQLVDESEGKIAWEYRHLPLPNHPLAFPAAVISECVAENIDLATFWQFTDAVFLAMGQLDDASLRSIALSLGLSEAKYEECANDRELQDRVQNDREVAAALGGRGTPFSLIVRADGSSTPVSGALPYEQWLTLVK